MPLVVCPLCRECFDWVQPLIDLRPYVKACKRCVDQEVKKSYEQNKSRFGVQ